MSKYNLEQYLDEQVNKTINNKIYNYYYLFGYKNITDFTIDLNFLLLTIYDDYDVIEDKNKRLDQNNFRNIIIDKYKTCIITDAIPEECDACHLIPVCKLNNYDIDNGILLSSNLHKTFDKFYWSINPDTLMVEINNNVKCGTIKQYVNKKIILNMNIFLYNNLKYHYDNFIKKIEL